MTDRHRARGATDDGRGTRPVCEADNRQRLTRNFRDGPRGVYLTSERYGDGFRYRIEVRNTAHPDYGSKDPDKRGAGRARVTRRTAAEALDEFDAQVEILQTRRGLTLGQVIDAFLAHKEAIGLAEPTIQSYTHRLGNACDRAVSVRDVSRDMIETWIDRYQNSGEVRGKRAVETAKATLRLLRQLFEWAIDRDYVQVNPTRRVRVKGKGRKGKPQLFEDEVRTWTKAVLDEFDDPTAPEWRRRGAIAVLIMFGGGLRSGEVRHLKVRDVNNQGTLLRVGVTVHKTDAATRRVRLAPAYAARLAVYVEGMDRDAFVFTNPKTGKPLSTQWLNAQTKRLCRLANVPEITPHGARGTHASIGRGAGETSLAIARTLGHEVGAPSVTDQHYVTREAREDGDSRRVLEELWGSEDGPTTLN